MNKSDLKPAVVFEQFAKINEIPRPSKREEKMIAYLKNWGESHGLETKVDETGNVLIRKAATKGMENRKTVILQSHMDMVCDKLVDVTFDFDKDAIKTYIDGEWLRDEETGLSGAEGMKAGFMNGDYLINLDSEDEGEIFVSCAGGRNTTAKFNFKRQPAAAGSFFIKGSLKGLVGGHSGDDINKKRANAIKILARFLFQTMKRYEGVQLAQFHQAAQRHSARRLLRDRCSQRPEGECPCRLECVCRRRRGRIPRDRPTRRWCLPWRAPMQSLSSNPQSLRTSSGPYKP